MLSGRLKLVVPVEADEEYTFALGLREIKRDDHHAHTIRQQSSRKQASKQRS